MLPWLLLAGASGAASSTVESSGYCTPCEACWPDEATWAAELGANLSSTAELHEVDVAQYKTCRAVPTSDLAAWTLLDDENGVCMQHHNCAYEECSDKNAWNLPAYTVKVVTEDDIVAALHFANAYNIPVSIKTSGHSYSGSSTLKGSLLIWMRHFTKYGQRTENFEDSCNNTYNTTVKIGGGQIWHEAYSAAGPNYDMVGGGGKTVSAAGGWLQGGGLSAMSPMYGLGIDNVVQMEVVTADGMKRLADACSEPDLFWALRGGGGGTYGVVTSVVYELHPVKPMVELIAVVNVSSYSKPQVFWDATQGEALVAWQHRWVDLQQGNGVDPRWGGYWQVFAGVGILYFLGSEAEARETMITGLEDWKASLPEKHGKWIDFHVRQTESYFKGTDREALQTDPGSHAQWDIDGVLIPRSWVLENNGSTAKAKFSEMVAAGQGSFHIYQLGGAVADVDPAATAIHPAMRAAQWSLIGSSATIAMLRDVPGWGFCNNHHGQAERELDTLFGSNLQRLQQIKARYDPDHRFNCYHCVGFRDMGNLDFTTCHEHLTSPASSAGAGHYMLLLVALFLLLPSMER